MSQNRTGRYFTKLIRPAAKPLIYGAIALVPTLGISLPLAAATTPLAASPDVSAEASNPVIQLSQLTASTVLNVEYPRAYTVRVYDAGGGQLRTNVYQRIDDVLEGNAAPTTFLGYPGNDGFAKYVATYNYQGVQRRAEIFYNPTTRASRLIIYNAARNVADFEESQAQRIITAQVPPPSALDPGVPAGVTNLAFDTGSYAVRVYTSDQGQRLMNIFSKQTNQTILRAQPVAVLDPVPPNANAVRYSAIGTFNGSPAQYVARVEPGANNAQLTILSTADNRVFLNETGNTTTVQIPAGDRPGVVGGLPITNTEGDLAPYVAAVFGNENTLAQIRQQAVPTAQFEDARLGRFINAGSFENRNQAESLVSYLRSLGFNSRLVYRDVDYR